jgi:hypothetical protein
MQPADIEQPILLILREQPKLDLELISGPLESRRHQRGQTS